MEAASTILTELEDYMKREALTISKFAARSGMNSGTLSNVIQGHRPIAMQQLDRITLAMNLPEGYFYDLYVDNYIINGAPDWRRIGPLLQRCADLNKLEAIHRVVQHIMDKLIYAPMLFDTAEELYAQGRLAAAALMYESVAEGERFQHSERLALCRYRLFTIGLGDSQEANLHAANQFEPYVERLDEADQLDALKHLADVFASLHRWEKVDELAELLGQKASLQYKHLKQESRQKQPVRPLIYYILYAYLSKAGVCDERGDYQKALYYTSLYSDVSWMKPPLSQEEQRVVDQFQEWAHANTYLYRLMSGEVEVLPEYISYIENKENEIPSALYKIIQAANRYDFDIDEILERFRNHRAYREQKSRLGKFTQQLTGDRHTRFMTELALYYLRHNSFAAGFHYLLEGLESSVIIKSDSNIVRCVGIFEKYRPSALPEHIQRYTNSMSEVYRINEKKDGLLDVTN
ncbi:helix-turn-helix domain-containing protein [Paenibacillus typhae]|uniref:HTH cro/C1-type domain-containing protein n=1 Tax=Paenibacillus typhae TaxID=1174501 RepID=A0A1G8KDZ1_9BACL|nr:helix-turn-helix transcriptional regulator [Paenibacillus typhae]SDI41621.1 hypothetical protein SAMN05216192_105115 [Paenibacillus typhae]